MKRLIQTYKPFSIIELSLLIYVLFNLGLLILKTTSDYFDLATAFILFLIPIIFSWKILSFTNRKIKVSDIFIYLGHIFNFIKLIPLALIVWGQLYFLFILIDQKNILPEKVVTYYLLIFASLLLPFASLFTFILYFGIAKENNKAIKNIIQSIGEIDP